MSAVDTRKSSPARPGRTQRGVSLSAANGQNPRVDAELACQIAAAYVAGGTQREISEQFGIYPRKVRQALLQEGVSARTPGTRLEDSTETATWVQRHSSGESVASIARTSGHGQYVVSRRLRQAGVELSRGPRAHQLRWDSEAVQAVIGRYEAGERLADIAKAEGVSANRLRFVLAKAGTPVGNFQEAHQQARRAMREASQPPAPPRPVVRRAVPRPDLDALRAEVARCALDLGLSPGDRLTMSMYRVWAKAHRAPTVTTLHRHLGSWGEAVGSVGLVPGPQPRTTYARLSRDDALAAVAEYVRSCREANEPPTIGGYGRWARGRGLPSESGLLLHWRWTELLDAIAS